MARVMISGLTRNTPTPRPLAPPADDPGQQPEHDGDERRPGVPGWPRRRPPAVATMVTERSMPAVSIRMVWPAAMIPSGAANSAELRSPVTLRYEGSMTPVIRMSTTSTRAEHDQGALPQPARPGAGRRLRQPWLECARGELGGHEARCLRSWSSPATIITRTMSSALDDLGLVGVDAHGGEHRVEEEEDDARGHRPDHRADAAGEGDATEHDGGDGVEGGVGAQREPGVAATDDGGGGQPGEGGEDPADGVGGHPGSGGVQPRQVGGGAAAPQGVQRQPGAGATQPPGDHDDRHGQGHQRWPRVAPDPRRGAGEDPTEPVAGAAGRRGQHHQGETRQDEAGGQGHHDVGDPVTSRSPNRPRR